MTCSGGPSGFSTPWRPRRRRLDCLWPGELCGRHGARFAHMITNRVTGGTPRGKVLTRSVVEIVGVPAELAAGSFDHVDVAEVRLT